MRDRAEFAYRRIQELLARPEWTKGGRLPGEIELAQEIGVSRPVLRQALARLRSTNAVVSRRGSGTYVVPKAELTDTPAGLPPFQIGGLSDVEAVLHFRVAIESAAAAEAAARRSDEALAAIEEANKELTTGTRLSGSMFRADFDFHMAVARASRNPLFPMTLDWLRPHIEVGYDLARRIRNVPLNMTSRRVAREHERILIAIRDRRIGEARTSMVDHLMAGIRRLFDRSDD